MRFRLPLGRTLFFVCALLLALVALIPMRIGLGWLGLADHGFAVREVEGSVWNGVLTEAQFASASLGDLHAGLATLPLAIGRARIDLERNADSGATETEDVIDGAITMSGGSFGLDDMRARLQTGSAFAPLPLRSINLDNVSAYFENGLCTSAEGMVSAELGGDLAGVPLPPTLAGNARCDGGELLLPLMSQSGMEQVNLRLGADSAYTLELVVNPSDEALRARLAISGFTPSGQGFAMTVRGTF